MPRLDAMTEKLQALGGDPGVAIEGPRAAVAAILRQTPGADAAEMFFILRAESPNDPWSGHVAFPGGRRDPQDESLLATAMRETLEEVGIDLKQQKFLARLPDRPTFTRSRKGGHLVVTPFVFAVEPDVAITPNYEVAHTLWVPIPTFLRPERDVFKLDYEGQTYDLPCIHLEPGNHRLWGLTYQMVESLLDVIR